jgi:cell division septation protein DedD
VAAQKLDFASSGTSQVIVEHIGPGSVPSIQTPATAPMPSPENAQQNPTVSQEIGSANVSSQQAAGLSSTSLQLGAFSSRDNAKRLQDKLVSLGYSQAKIIVAGALNKVVIGPVASSQVGQLQQRLLQQGFVSTKFSN